MHFGCTLVLLLAAVASARIGLVEWHHHVLVHIMNATKHGDIGRTGATLVHFDSHADMAVPKLFKNDDLWTKFDQNPAEIISFTEINNWVPATWLLGIVDRMIFIEPPWGGEFVPNAHRSLVYTIGELDGKVSLDIKTPDGTIVNQDYWHTVDDGKFPNAMDHFANGRPMKNARTIQVEILNYLDLLQGKLVNFLKSTPTESPIILDIDLDVFSTESPVLLWWLEYARISVREGELLGNYWRNRKSLYAEQWRDYFNTNQKDYCPALLNNVVLEENLQEKDAHTHIRGYTANLNSLPELNLEGVVAKLWDAIEMHAEDRLEEKEFICRSLQKYEEAIQDLVNTHGAEFMSNQLLLLLRTPVNLGSQHSIQIMVNALECVLSQGKAPKVITISRSPQYSPAHMIETMECKIYEMIGRLWPQIKDIYSEQGMNADRYQCSPKFAKHEVDRLDYDWPFPVENELKSYQENLPIFLIVINNTPDKLVMNWINQDKIPQEEDIVQPYSQLETLSTHHDNDWQIVTAVDRVVVKEFAASAHQGHTVTIRIETREVSDARIFAGVAPVHIDY